MTPLLARSYSYCEQLARREAGNFYHAFRVLPRPQRQAMCALYAFMRVADDLTDGVDTPDAKHAALLEWRQQFDGALTGHYSHALHAAFHHTVQTYAIPRQYIDDVLDGVQMDLFQTSYSTFSELRRYCYRVASAVGLACIHIWGFREAQATVYAESAGIAFQLTNILRDLSEDVERGRVYLPEEDFLRFGYTMADLRAKIRNDAFRDLMAFEVMRARQFYREGLALSDLLQAPGRAVFQVMTRTYEGLLDAIEERDYDVFSSRVSLSRWHKLGLVVQAMPARWGWA